MSDPNLYFGRDKNLRFISNANDDASLAINASNVSTEGNEPHRQGVQNLAALTAISENSAVDKQVILVEDDGALYRFDAEAVTGDFMPDDQTGGTGYWILVGSPAGSMSFWNFGAARNQGNTTNIYLRRTNGLSTNQTPFIALQNCTIYGITASTQEAETWTAKVFIDSGSGFPVSPSAATGEVELAITANNSGGAGASYDLNTGDKIALYCGGAGINRPAIDIYIKSR